MTDQNRKTSLLAGAFVLCGLILLGGLVVEFGSLRHSMRNPYRLKATFLDAQNLIKNAPVKRAGAVIGRVGSNPELMDGLRGVTVELEIYPEFQIPKGSRFSVVAVGLMGDSMVDVTLPEAPTGEFLIAGDHVEGERGGDLSSVAGRLSDEAVLLMKDLRKAVLDLDNTIRRLDAGAFSDANLENLSGAIAGIRKAADTIDSEVLGEANRAELKAALAGLRRSVDGAETAVKSAGSAFAKADKAFDQLGPSLKSIQETTGALTKTAGSIDAFTKELRSGKGLLYAIVNDEKLKEDVVRFIANLRRDGLLWYDDEEEKADKKKKARTDTNPSARRP